jgi:hypothetical protein
MAKRFGFVFGLVLGDVKAKKLWAEVTILQIAKKSRPAAKKVYFQRGMNDSYAANPSQ